VYSLTTNPHRIKHLARTINSLLNQDWLPDLIQVNIPWLFKRTNETFEEWQSIEILKHPLVKVHRTQDKGPITKLIGALETERNHTLDALIIIVDDDRVYHRALTQKMKQWAADEPGFVITTHCIDTMLMTNPESDFLVAPFNNTELNNPDRAKCCCCCRFNEGYGAVGFRVSFFSRENVVISWERYLEIALADAKCYRTDDLVISNYMSLIGIQALDVRLNSKPTDLNEDKYALYKQNFSDSHTQNVKAKNLVLKGHPYYHCSRHLFSNGVGYLRPYIPEDLDVNATVQDRWIMRCMKSKVVYLIQNQTRRPFASGNALLNMGFQFTDIREIDHHHSRCQKEFLWMPVGQPIT